MPLEVIGAGYGRTGTYSLKLALEQLGLPCYHFAELADHPADISRWAQATTAVMERGQAYDFEQIFSPVDPGRPAYRAGVDCPVNVFYKQLLQQYPAAKVILTVRQSPQAWHRSVMNTVHKFSTQIPWYRELLMQLSVPWRRQQLSLDQKHWSPWVYDKRFPDLNWATTEVYEQRIAEVKSAVPADQLLIFDVQQGWGPLCGFLGLPVPDTPFPRTNTTEDMLERMKQLHDKTKKIETAVAAAMAVLAGVAVGLYIHQRRNDRF